MIVLNNIFSLKKGAMLARPFLCIIQDISFTCKSYINFGSRFDSPWHSGLWSSWWYLFFCLGDPCNLFVLIFHLVFYCCKVVHNFAFISIGACDWERLWLKAEYEREWLDWCYRTYLEVEVRLIISSRYTFCISELVTDPQLVSKSLGTCFHCYQL